MSWRDDKELKQLSLRSKDKIEAFFEVEKRAVTVGHILHTMNIDFRTIKRILESMVKHGVLEKIETSNQPVYRKIEKKR